jgi:hypothetical protein
VPELTPRHSDGSISADTLSFFEHIKRAPNSDDECWSWCEHIQAGSELIFIAKHQIKNYVEMTFRDPAKR